MGGQLPACTVDRWGLRVSSVRLPSGWLRACASRPAGFLREDIFSPDQQQAAEEPARANEDQGREQREDEQSLVRHPLVLTLPLVLVSPICQLAHPHFNGLLLHGSTHPPTPRPVHGDQLPLLCGTLLE